MTRTATPRASHLGALALLLALGLAALAPRAARADDEAKPDASSQQGGIVVMLDIEETLDGEESDYAVTAYYVRKKLREVGFRAWSARPIPVDDAERKKRAEKAKKDGTTAEPLLDDQKPEGGLVVRGTATVTYDRTSTFYGADLAQIYKGAATLTIADRASGKTLVEITIDDEWGKKTKKAARNECLKRVGLFAAADVVASQPVQDRLTDQGKTQAQAFIDQINAKRKEKGGDGQ